MKKGLLFLVIAFCFVGLQSKEASAETNYKIWFYNSAGWQNVNAYIWGEEGELLGGWPGTPAIQDGDSHWWYIESIYDVPFNIIFNAGGAQAGNVYIDQQNDVYLTVEADKIYQSKIEAEEAVEDLDIISDGETTLWFYNTNGWKDVYLYIYGTLEADILGPWPGTQAERVDDSHWYTITVPSGTPFNAILNDGTDANKAEVYISDDENVYITVENDVRYSNKTSAEAAIDTVLPIPTESDEFVEVPETDYELEQETITLVGKASDRIVNAIAIASLSIIGLSAISLSTLILILKNKK